MTMEMNLFKKPTILKPVNTIWKIDGSTLLFIAIMIVALILIISAFQP